MEIYNFMPKCLHDFSQSTVRIYDEIHRPKNVNLIKDMANVIYFIFKLGMTAGIFFFLKPSTPFESRLSLKRVLKWAGCVLICGKAGTNLALGADLLFCQQSRNGNKIVSVAAKLLGVGVLLSAKDSGERSFVEDYMNLYARAIATKLNKKFFPNARQINFDEDIARV